MERENRQHGNQEEGKSARKEGRQEEKAVTILQTVNQGDAQASPDLLCGTSSKRVPNGDTFGRSSAQKVRGRLRVPLVYGLKNRYRFFFLAAFFAGAFAFFLVAMLSILPFHL